jgi:NAD(P)-dependent dehydrogenase (short-subunit alcohol dehydrogenase family)
MSVSISLEGRTALVTGAGRNVGRAIALALADAGAAVACAWRENELAAQATCDQIVAGGGTAVPVQVDLRSVPALRAAVAETEERLGSLDILVNCAAVRPHARIDEISEERWDTVLGINLRGPFFLAQAAIPGMKRRGWGRIVNISGVDVYWAGPQRSHVVASKAGLSGLTRALANETARWGITVNAIVPGILDTVRVGGHSEEVERWLQAFVARVPVGRIGRPEEVAFTCLFLVSEQAGYITGQEVIVSGGAFPLSREINSEYD